MTHHKQDFEGKIVIITGGSRGIGRATAEQFAAKGASLVIASRDPIQGQTVAKQLPDAIYVQTDVRVPSDCERVITEALATYNRLDVLVNSAGIIYRNRTVEQTTEEEWDATMETNVKGVFLMSKFALPALRQSKGSIVNLASYVGLVGYKATSAYAASKAALVNLTRSMALDHAHEQIRINCVCPGSVATDMIFKAWEAYDNVEQAEQIYAAKHPLGRIAMPEEIAEAILFLASSHSSFITGVALPVDGGITAG